MNDSTKYKLLAPSPAEFGHYGFTHEGDLWLWQHGDCEESMVSISFNTKEVVWYRGCALCDAMIDIVIQSMLDNELIAHTFEEDEDEISEDEIDGTMVCAACGEEPDPDTNYCRECEEYIEPVPRYTLED